LSSLFSDPRTFGIAFVAAAVIMAVVAILAHFKKKKLEARPVRPPVDAEVRKPETSHPGPPVPPAAPPQEVVPAPAARAPAFVTLEKPPRLMTDLFRALLIALSVAALAALVLIALPQPTVNRIADSLNSRHGGSRLEKIAFLYLGDATLNNEWHIRGVVRNVSTAPLEQLDAIVRFYTHDRTLLETTIVRMNKEIINPGETAQFELIYPVPGREYAGYSAEFKLRQGTPVSYIDMRKAQPHPE
jgi:hypothetical protein